MKIYPKCLMFNWFGMNDLFEYLTKKIAKMMIYFTM